MVEEEEAEKVDSCLSSWLDSRPESAAWINQTSQTNRIKHEAKEEEEEVNGAKCFTACPPSIDTRELLQY